MQIRMQSTWLRSTPLQRTRRGYVLQSLQLHICKEKQIPRHIFLGKHRYACSNRSVAIHALVPSLDNTSDILDSNYPLRFRSAPQ